MKTFRTSFAFKVLTVYLSLNMIFPLSGIQTGIFSGYALTGGPSQPEFNSFTPIGTSDMVDLSSGDFNYNIPIMDVGGYPLNLAYNSGITMDQEASWVGLGWNLNVGQINRNVRGLPDDFNGDEMVYQNSYRPSRTFGINTSVTMPIFGNENLSTGGPNFNVGLGVTSNNMTGVTFNLSLGPSFDLGKEDGKKMGLGIGLNSTSSEGASVSVRSRYPSSETDGIGSSIGLGMDSRQTLPTFSFSATNSHEKGKGTSKNGDAQGGVGGSIDLNSNVNFSPTNKLSFLNRNLSVNVGIGTEIMGNEGPQFNIRGWGKSDVLKKSEEHNAKRSYGYANIQNADRSSILDFNNINEKSVSENTNVLAFPDHTYDTYSIQSQGLGGAFRPFRGQVVNLFHNKNESKGVGGDAGVELGPGSYAHTGGNIKLNFTETKSGSWNDDSNVALNKFSNKANNSKVNFENVHYAMVNELSNDNIASKIYDESPVGIRISKKPGPYGIAYSQYQKKNDISNYTNVEINKPVRDERIKRFKGVQMIKSSEADSFIQRNSYAEDDHYAGIKIYDESGSRYVYGETIYNINKEERSFAVNSNAVICDGYVNYSDTEDSVGNHSGRDHYFNNIMTPSYAHTYLLTAVLSSDYEDLQGDGITDDDLGSYTKFTYTDKGNYQWRAPYADEGNKALYSRGLNTDSEDSKGSYTYGEKEMKYIQKIETKTHIAIFDLSPRKDGYGVNDKNGTADANTASKMYKLNKIRLYAKRDFYNEDGTINNNAVPIKTANFIYDYSLCPDVNNNLGGNSNNLHNEYNVNDLDANTNKGKLTLKKVYFTYQNSNLGAYTPYVFNYDMDNNPAYDFKAHDIWGNYKERNDGSCDVNADPSTAEYPFVDQTQTVDKANNNAKSWSLKSIDLPSGGTLELDYESDDYQYVQDKKAMQMFKVAGFSDTNNDVGNDRLYGLGGQKDYIVIELNEAIGSDQEFIEKYLTDPDSTNGLIGTKDNPMYFNVMLNMTNSKYDFVSGYVLFDDVHVFENNQKQYVSLKLEMLEKEGGLFGGNDVNPIAKAGWYFGRNHLNGQIYNLPGADGSASIVQVAEALVQTIPNMFEIFHGPNQALINKGCAKKAKLNKSWVRLHHPNGRKFGGGLRVKTLKLNDNWDTMTHNLGSQSEYFKNSYGQEYNYLDEEGKSYGVASFEPNYSKENPMVLPFYDDNDKLVAPKEFNYTETPFALPYFPSSKVTYSKVTVKNLERNRDENGVNLQVKKHATGEIVNEFFTSRDFPTVEDKTDIVNDFRKTDPIGAFLRVRTKNRIALSQGFTIKTNNMDGKPKRTTVKAESGDDAENVISKVEYIYNLDEDGNLDNNVPVVQPNGDIVEKEIGVTYDMNTFFSKTTNNTTIGGADINVGIIPFLFGAPLPIPTVFPVYQKHSTQVKIASTAKVINQTGILKKTIAYDLGSRVSTENLAWDENSGTVIATQVNNDYDDAYYSVNYPANWYYDGMKNASTNLDLAHTLVRSHSSATNFLLKGVTDDLNEYFTQGDEISISNIDMNEDFTPEDDPNGDSYDAIIPQKLWVANVSGEGITLMDREGRIMNKCEQVRIDEMDFKVVRSGFRNLLTASMQSVTTQNNPIYQDEQLQNRWQNIKDFVNQSETKIVNASAISYSDFWKNQSEGQFYGSWLNGDFFTNDTFAGRRALNTEAEWFFNPFVHNVKGDWKAKRSYAYLTGRTQEVNGDQTASPRNSGFFSNFSPYYDYNGSNWHINNPIPWTFASEVSQYSPYGVELENKDALDRYSSAQYGYNYTLPTAVSSNAKYGEIGFDGFEDYDAANPNTHFGFHNVEDIDDQIDEAHAHTGRKSIRVAPNSSTVMSKNLSVCQTPEIPLCPPIICSRREVNVQNESLNCIESGTHSTEPFAVIVSNISGRVKFEIEDTFEQTLGRKIESVSMYNPNVSNCIVRGSAGSINFDQTYDSQNNTWNDGVIDLTYDAGSTANYGLNYSCDDKFQVLVTFDNDDTPCVVEYSVRLRTEADDNNNCND